MDEVISLNVVFLNQFQRNLIHAPIGVRYIWMLSFFNSFEFVSFNTRGPNFLLKVLRLKVKLERTAFSKSFCQFWDRFRKMEVFEDDTLHCLSVWKKQKTIFAVSRWVLWPLDRGEAGSDLVFFFLQIVLFSQANEPVHGLVYMRITQCADKKQLSLWQSKVASSITLLQKPGHWAHNCKNSPFWFSVPDNSKDCCDNQVLSTNVMIIAGSLNFFATV